MTEITSNSEKVQMKILLVIPAYNEEKSIVSVVEDAKGHGYDYVVINDGSTDHTLEICIEHGINILDLPRNLGIGGAVQAGHKYAYRHGYDVDVQIDGDGQHDISSIPVLLKKIEDGADLVIGSRFLKKTDGFQSTTMRRLGIKWLSGLLHFLYRKRITDPTSGLRASNRKAQHLFCISYPMDYPEPESIAEALNSGLIITEAPVCMRERSGGKSSIGTISSVYYMIKVSLAILISRLKKRIYI